MEATEEGRGFTVSVFRYPGGGGAHLLCESLEEGVKLGEEYAKTLRENMPGTPVEVEVFDWCKRCQGSGTVVVRPWTVRRPAKRGPCPVCRGEPQRTLKKWTIGG